MTTDHGYITITIHQICQAPGHQSVVQGKAAPVQGVDPGFHWYQVRTRILASVQDNKSKTAVSQPVKKGAVSWNFGSGILTAIHYYGDDKPLKV